MENKAKEITKEEIDTSISSEELLEAHTKVKSFLAYLNSSFIVEEEDSE